MHPLLSKLNKRTDEEEVDMEGLLECVEWLNVNRNARLKVTAKEDNFKKNKNANKNANKQASKKAGCGSGGGGGDPADSALYLVHVVGQRLPDNNNLVACLASDQVVNVYEQRSLKERYKIHQRVPQGKNLNEVGFYKQDPHMLYTCGDDGSLRVFDLRMADTSLQLFQKEALCFSAPAPREFLCADINADDSLFAIGTNKKIDDALVYLFDVRFSSKHLHQLCESHSMDITQIKFSPSERNKFCSGSTDGLVCLYDMAGGEEARELAKAETNSAKSEGGADSSVEDDDPDLMSQVYNTDAAIAKLSYLEGGGQLAAVTYTNGVFVWDVASDETVYRSPQAHNSKDASGVEAVRADNDEDYYVDCVYAKDAEGAPVLTTCMADRRGNLRVYQRDQLVFHTDRENSLRRRFHRDVVRSAFFHDDYLFTCGEDGFLLKWFVSKERVEAAEGTDDTRKQKLRRDDDYESDSDLERLSQEKFDRKVRFNKKKRLNR